MRDWGGGKYALDAIGLRKRERLRWGKRWIGFNEQFHCRIWEKNVLFFRMHLHQTKPFYNYRCAPAYTFTPDFGGFYSRNAKYLLAA